MKKLTPLIVFVFIVSSFLLYVKHNADKRDIISNNIPSKVSSDKTPLGNSNNAEGYTVEFLPTKVSIKNPTPITFTVKKGDKFITDIKSILVINKSLSYVELVEVTAKGNKVNGKLNLTKNGIYYFYVPVEGKVTLGYEMDLLPLPKTDESRKITIDSSNYKSKIKGPVWLLSLDRNLNGSIKDIENTSKINFNSELSILVSKDDKNQIEVLERK